MRESCRQTHGGKEVTRAKLVSPSCRCWLARGFSFSWLEIPGNVIYITSQPNHSARNPSSQTNLSASCLGRQRCRRGGVDWKEGGRKTVKKRRLQRAAKERAQAAGVCLSTQLLPHHCVIMGNTLLHTRLNANTCTAAHVHRGLSFLSVTHLSKQLYVKPVGWRWMFVRLCVSNKSSLCLYLCWGGESYLCSDI